MALKAQGLTTRKVASITEPGMYGDGNGLYLLVGPTGAKSWVYRFQLRGRRRDMGLGPVDLITLAEARAKAHDCRRMVYEGRDPIEARRGEEARQRTVPTLLEAVRAHVQAKAPALSKARVTLLEGLARRYVEPSPPAGKLVDTVDTSDVLAMVSPIWTEKTTSAVILRLTIEGALDQAKVEGHRQGDNPARWKGHLDKILPSPRKVAPPKHHGAVPWRDMPDLWRKLADLGTPGARALQFLVLTAGRRNEIREMVWTEVDMDARTWTVPAGRMKSDREHRVPLSPAAVVLLERQQAEPVGADGRVWPIGTDAMKTALTRAGWPGATVHGMRSAFRTWASEETSAPHEVCEAALAHVTGDEVVRSYQRGDLFERRRHLMDQWAAYVAGEGAARVVPLRREAGR